MEEKNKNISDTFGKYNNVGQVKNVSSSMWEPISAGKSSASGKTSPQKQGVADRQKKTNNTSPTNKKTKKQPASKNKKNAGEKPLISQGKPDAKTQTTSKKQPAKSSQSKKTSSGKKNPPSRTPTGRDLRKDARQQQKHREELFKFRESYKQQINNQRNHDEISRLRNDGKRKKLVIKNAVTVGSVMLFALIFILIYCYSRGALIENIVIDGGSIYSAQEIQQAAGISVGKNMLSLREKKVSREITRKLPYIKEVEMEYDLPDTLILTVVSTSDKYLISGQGTWLTLDNNGKVVSDTKKKLEAGLFRADGFDYQEFSTGDTYTPQGLNEERYRILEKLVTLFEKSEVVESAVINLQNTQDVIVTVDDKIAVYLGDCKNPEEKIPYASGIIAQVRETGKKGYIDMRFDLGYFKPGSMTIQ